MSSLLAIFIFRETACVPICIGNCSNHGVCTSPHTCQCDLGYTGRNYTGSHLISVFCITGENCSVQCECNGHSNCVDDTVIGRATCLECLHNTQVVIASHFTCVSNICVRVNIVIHVNHSLSDLEKMAVFHVKSFVMEIQ